MTQDEKLDHIISLLENIQTEQEAQTERQEQIVESIANLSLPGSNFSYERVDDLDEY